MLEQVGAKYSDLTAPSILLNINKWDFVVKLSIRIVYSASIKCLHELETNNLQLKALLSPEVLTSMLGQEWSISEAPISG